jgi:hypothetical protein
MSAKIDFMSNPFTDINMTNKQTAMHNYLGYNPQQQSKSDQFHNYLSYKPTYFVTSNDYDLPKQPYMVNKVTANPRYEFSTYSLPKSNLSAEEIRKYKDILNPHGIKQVEFKTHELYGYIESLT